MAFKKKMWHPWIDLIVEIGEQVHSKSLLTKLVSYCEDSKKTTIHLPKQNGLSFYLKHSGKFKLVGMEDGKQLWERVN
tara:strand:+ start:3939 stop:4172 length:234 start_codon:yes stop_codon:yes gene_type:complete